MFGESMLNFQFTIRRSGKAVAEYSINPHSPHVQRFQVRKVRQFLREIRQPKIAQVKRSSLFFALISDAFPSDCHFVVLNHRASMQKACWETGRVRFSRSAIVSVGLAKCWIACAKQQNEDWQNNGALSGANRAMRFRDRAETRRVEKATRGRAALQSASSVTELALRAAGPALE